MNFSLRLLTTAALVIGCSPAFGQSATSSFVVSDWPVHSTPDLLEMHQIPASDHDRSHGIFFDQGAWHGYALPLRTDSGSGFIGPFLGATGGGRWTGGRFATIDLVVATTGKPLSLAACDHGGTALPGALVRRSCGAGVTVSETLFFASASTAVARVSVKASRSLSIRVKLGGSQSDAALAPGDRLQVQVPGTSIKPTPSTGGHYTFALPDSIVVGPGKNATFYLQQSYFPAIGGTQLPSWNGSPEVAWQSAGERWKGYLDQSARLRSELMGRDDVMRINRKAVMTLLANWRAPIGDLRHQGVFPSYSNPDFNAFWAWDSWKHAAALASFAPALAKDQVRAMFDYQQPDGMIPDKISRYRQENNLRDTKPPLATWAVAEIYRQTHDRAFVAEMFVKLYRYHQWWEQNRDHDHNGLAEYGATDGTREAAGWESGMDNAVRFDKATMLRNGEHAWSLDQESVDLNSYLYQEKLELAALATMLGKNQLAATLQKQADVLKTAIQQTFFDKDAGYFFDVHLESHTAIRVFGPEGWTPLWTGAATKAQALAVGRVLNDPAKFNTTFPFPTLAADDPRFTPSTGYWRGPVWIDQAVFAVQGLERYGLTEEARAMREKLLTHSPGLSGHEPFRETYNPETGAGQNSFNFSWSAAEYFLLIH